VVSVPVATSPAKHPVPTAIRDPALLLDIDVDQLTRTAALVAHHLTGGPVQLPQPWELLAAQDGRDRGGRLAKHPADAMGPDPAAQPTGQDRLFPRCRQPPWAAMRPRGPVSQPWFTFGAPTPQPLVGRRAGDALGLGGHRHRPALLEDPFHQQPTAQHAQFRLTMHRESLLAEFLDSPQRGGSHSLNNLPGNHS
jgi:hypothetical protein